MNLNIRPTPVGVHAIIIAGFRFLEDRIGVS
jgi:hypothetical protein